LGPIRCGKVRQGQYLNAVPKQRLIISKSALAMDPKTNVVKGMFEKSIDSLIESVKNQVLNEH